MKTKLCSFLISFLAGILLSMSACGDDKDKKTDPTEAQYLKTVDFRVTTVTCPPCRTKILTAVSPASGVSDVKVSLHTEKHRNVSVTYDTRKTDPGAIKMLITAIPKKVEEQSDPY